MVWRYIGHGALLPSLVHDWIPDFRPRDILQDAKVGSTCFALTRRPADDFRGAAIGNGVAVRGDSTGVGGSFDLGRM